MIVDAYRKIHSHIQSLSSTTQLICISKGNSLAAIKALYDIGVRDFGENRVEELTYKASSLPQDINWHFVGNVQRKKLNKLLSIPVCIHSIDRISLLETLQSKEVSVRGFIQVNTSGERSKSGFSEDEFKAVHKLFTQDSHLHIEGLMTMAPKGATQSARMEVFSKLANLRDQYLPQGSLSMGMSGDYVEAICAGATHLRIGSAIFSQAAKGS